MSKLTTEEIKALTYIRCLGKAYIQDVDGFWDVCSEDGDTIIHEYSDELMEVLVKDGLLEYK